MFDVKLIIAILFAGIGLWWYWWAASKRLVVLLLDSSEKSLLLRCEMAMFILSISLLGKLLTL